MLGTGRMLNRTLPARVESLHELLAFIGAGAEGKGFSKDAVNRIRLVAEEALVNVFNYAYARGTQGEVEVRLVDMEGPEWGIEIRDQGIPFDPLSVADPDVEADIAERKIGGMGIFFIRSMTDAVRYRRDADTNVLTLIFSSR